MRKITAIIAAILLAAGMIGTAMAAPVITDGNVTAWIGENDRLLNTSDMQLAVRVNRGAEVLMVVLVLLSGFLWR